MPLPRHQQGPWLSRPLLLYQHPPHRRSPQAQVPHHCRLTQALLRQRANLRRIVGCGAWSAMRLPALACVRNARLHPLTDQIPFKLREDGEGAPCRRGEIERLRQRDEPHPEGREFVQRCHQIDEGASPAAQLPYENDVELALLGGLEQRLALWATVLSARGDLLHRVDDGPAASGGELAHGVYLHGQGVLVVGRDTSIEGNAYVVG